jgi:VWFA-related protein
MRLLRINTRARFLLSHALLLSFLLPHPTFGQTAAQTPPAATPPQDDVLRINTSLVQTDVIVLDKQGRSVKGLSKEQFELLVDGQPQEISFFESVETGSLRESAQLAAARGTGGAPNAAQPAFALARPSAGRSFIFYVDDLHLTPEGVQRARDLLNNFVSGMGEDDQALVISPSGQVGFLQQLTDNRAALKLAVSRLKYQAQAAPLTTGRRQMTVYEALAIDRNQRNVIDYKAKEYIDDMGLTRAPSDTPSALPRSSAPGQVDAPRVTGTDQNNRQLTAEMAIKAEARVIMQHANDVSDGVLGSLEFVARGAGTLPGRKLFFFISDGFVLDPRGAHSAERLQRVIDTAARSGVAIYTVDTKGLSVGNVTASQDVFSDIAIGSSPGAPLNASADASSISFANDSASKEILRTLAADTGGRAILNRNDLESGVNNILKETEAYYVLAWRPRATVDSGKPKFTTLKVGLKGRPDLRVLSRGGFYTAPPAPIASDTKPVVAKDSKGAPLKPSEAELRAAISSAFPRRQLGVSAYTSYSNESGDAYKIVTFADLSNYQVAPGAGGKAAGDVDFYVTLLNSEGKAVTSVGQKVNIAESSQQPFRVAATLPNLLPPGLYQVRVAARDAQSGRVGSSFQWLDIPKFKPGELALSNPLLAEITGKAGETPALSVERRFSRKSDMLIQMFIYNAGAAGALDVAVTMQVLQGGKQLIAAPPQPIQTAGVADPTRLPYGAQIPLAGFPPGRYTLKLTVNDRSAKANASQQINFTVE